MFTRRTRKIAAGIAFAGVTATGGTFAADRAIDPYHDRGDKYVLEITSDIPQGERVEIHKDRAQMDLKFWNDEHTISIIPQIPTAQLGASDRPFTTKAARPLLSKRMEFKEGEVTAFIEPKEGTENEFDIDFTLESKPDTNVFTYKIEGAEEFDFFYQPELSPEEIAEGAVRPENVVGSYAVYHKTKAHHRLGSTNYGTGKAFHIYRPKAVDASGSSIWADLNYERGILSVTVPQKFLDQAAYPVTVDPTFGNTTTGSTNAGAICILSGDNANLVGTARPLQGAGGTISSLHAAFVAASGSETTDFWVGVYRENSAGVGSHDRVVGVELTDVTVDTTPAFYTFTAGSESLVTDDYILAVVCNGADLTAANVEVRGDSLGTFTVFDTYAELVGGGYTTLRDENPWTEGLGFSGLHRSIYLTYEAAPSSQVVEEYLVSTTWTAPTGVTSAQVACWGGGGGGFDDNTAANGGAGGGGGAFASSTVALTPGNNYSITVASTSPENLPTVGKFSQFVADDKTVLACGGTGATSATVNGVGGTTACSTGDVENAGGAGADAVTTDDTGGGGGGAGGPHATGGAAANGQAGTGGGGGGGNGGAASGQTGGTAGINGGNGGNGASASQGVKGANGIWGGGGGGGGDNGTNGGNGGLPGGGGGGAEGEGGVGASGQCTVTYTIAAGGGAPPADTTLINILEN